MFSILTLVRLYLFSFGIANVSDAPVSLMPPLNIRSCVCSPSATLCVISPFCTNGPLRSSASRSFRVKPTSMTFSGTSFVRHAPPNFSVSLVAPVLK